MEAMNYNNAIKTLVKINVIDNFNKINNLYKEFLGILLNRKLIDYDEYCIYQKSYPHFKIASSNHLTPEYPDDIQDSQQDSQQEFIYFLTSYLL
jgi:hypothetical protein